MKVFLQAVQSLINYFRLVFSGNLHLETSRLGQLYKAKDLKAYSVFLETRSDKDYGEKEVTLVVGFRLFLIGSNPFFHWLFMHLCILDTPVWVGFSGFRFKLWMVQPKTKDYLGIYRYQGKENAKKYAEYISAVLRPVSTKNSVWYKIYEEKFEDYLKANKV